MVANLKCLFEADVKWFNDSHPAEEQVDGKEEETVALDVVKVIDKKAKHCVFNVKLSLLP